jgi:very-short-patch-repair endonuclease
MAGKTVQSSEIWAVVRRQHGVVSRRQLLGLGLTDHAIDHRKATGKLHPVRRGVFAVGRPDLTRYGQWTAAVLACGEGSALSHETAAALWEIAPAQSGPIHISVPAHRRAQGPGLVVHRRENIDVTTHRNISVTTPEATLTDLAASNLTLDQLEAAINEADKRDLTDPDHLRASLDEAVSRPGAARLRRILDRATFTLTDSALERAFMRIVGWAGLPRPQTQSWVNGFKVDFYWPDLGLIVETDGLRYHRTPAQQARDRERDQTHAAAGLTPLRFTHAQVARDAAAVEATLKHVARRRRRA